MSVLVVVVFDGMTVVEVDVRVFVGVAVSVVNEVTVLFSNVVVVVVEELEQVGVCFSALTKV